MHIFTENKGISLIAVYLVIVILVILGAAFFMQSYSESKLAQRHKISTRALCIAESGIERALYDLRQDFINDPTPSWADGDINGIVCGPDYNNFYTLHASIPLDDGSYTVTLRNITGTTDSVWVRSAGTYGGITRTVQTYIQLVGIYVWDNAIFAGAGASGTLINGNVDIRGSVHILGTGLNIDEMAMDMAIDLAGSANIGNNYEGMPSELRNKIPALDTTTYNGEEVETLNAELRVKQGIVGLSGSATVGAPDVSGNAYKETMDGAYVNDGFGGNKGTANVYSDNGTENKYDLGDSVTFPSLSDPYGVYATYMDYLRDNALVISEANDLDVLSNITPGSNFSYTSPLGSISMDGNGNLTITGVVYIDGGSLNINSQGANNTITYTGMGSILAEGNVSIKANLVTAGNNSFPDNIIGVMTPNTITFDGAQIDIMGMFYAEDTITSYKQTDVAGSFVSNFFDMGSQVPSIYLVPEAIDHLPPGLIGATPFYSIKVVTWQET